MVVNLSRFQIARSFPLVAFASLRRLMAAAFWRMAISQTEPDSRRERIWRIIFLSDTRAGHLFDVALLWLIVLSVLTSMLESVEELRLSHGSLFVALGWVFTGVSSVWRSRMESKQASRLKPYSRSSSRYRLFTR